MAETLPQRTRFVFCRLYRLRQSILVLLAQLGLRSQHTHRKHPLAHYENRFRSRFPWLRELKQAKARAKARKRNRRANVLRSRRRQRHRFQRRVTRNPAKKIRPKLTLLQRRRTRRDPRWTRAPRARLPTRRSRERSGEPMPPLITAPQAARPNPYPCGLRLRREMQNHTKPRPPRAAARWPRPVRPECAPSAGRRRPRRRRNRRMRHHQRRSVDDRLIVEQ